MTQNFFYAGDGTPLTGLIPLRIIFHGPTAEADKIRGEANNLLNTFLAEVRLGGLAQLRRDASLTNGGYMRMAHSFGTTTVDAYVGGDTPTSDEFFGGILIKPHILRPGSPVYTENSPAALWDDVLAAQTSGRTATLAGRPAVPGTGVVATDWLVLQVHPTKSLSSEPIKTGAVKVFRIKDPKFGDLVEVNQKAAYLVSTKAPGTEFYVCGKKMIRVPAFPITLSAFASARTLLEPRVRLRTFQLEIPSFEKAEKAEAFIFMAVGGALYGIDTKNRPPSGIASWQLLASVPAAESREQNAFGDQFTQTSVGGVVTIRCYGTNKLGPRSEFTATITPQPTGRPVLTGSVTLKPTGWVARAAPSAFDQKTITYSLLPQTPQIDSFEFSYAKFNIDDPLDTYYARTTGNPETDGAWVDSIETYNRYVSYQAYGFYWRLNSSYDTNNGLPGVTPNEFLGGVLPDIPHKQYHVESSSETRVDDFLGYHFRLKGLPPLKYLGTQIGITDMMSAPFWPSSSGVVDVGDMEFAAPGSLGLYFGAGDVGGDYVDEFHDFYYGQPLTFSQYKDGSLSWIESQPSLYGWVYPFTVELSGVFDPWEKGISSATSPTIPPLPWLSTALYYQYPRQDGVELVDPNFLGYPYVAYGAFPDEGPIAGTTTFMYDAQLISAYPKRAAVFAVQESWSTTITDSYSYGPRVSFSASKSRQGHVRADEYLAAPWPTNIAEFPALTPISTSTDHDDAALGQAGSWDSSVLDPEESSTNVWRAMDHHTGKLAWKSVFFTTGTWTQFEDPGLNPNMIPDYVSPQLSRFEVQRTSTRFSFHLQNPDGVSQLGWDDLDEAYAAPPTHSLTHTPAGFYRARARPDRWTRSVSYGEEGLDAYVDTIRDLFDLNYSLGFQPFEPSTYVGVGAAVPALPSAQVISRPMLKIGYWNRAADGGDLDPLMPVFRAEGLGLLVGSISSVVTNSRISPNGEGDPTGGAIWNAKIGEDAKNVYTRIYRDVRTGGFVTGFFWVGAGTWNGGTGAPCVGAYIGNASGVVPLGPVLQEWAALGSGGEQPLEHLLIVDPDALGSPESLTANVSLL